MAWKIENYDSPSTETNPIAFLADFTIDGSAKFLSNAGWLAGTSLFPTDNAVAYGFNGGDNLWTTNLGHAVTGISTSASWIGLGAYPGSSEIMYISTAFTVPDTAPVVTPEPGTMLLLGLGMSGMALLRRRVKRSPV